MALLHFCSIHSTETHVLVMSPFIPMFYCNWNDRSERKLWQLNPGSTFPSSEAICCTSQTLSCGAPPGFETWLRHFLARRWCCWTLVGASLPWFSVSLSVDGMRGLTHFTGLLAHN